MSIRRLSILTLGIVLYPGLARAQSPIAAGTAPSVSVSLGYSAVSLGMTPSSRVALNGLDASATTDFLSRIGAKLDVGYARASNVFARIPRRFELARRTRRSSFAAQEVRRLRSRVTGRRPGYGARPGRGRGIR